MHRDKIGCNESELAITVLSEVLLSVRIFMANLRNQRSLRRTRPPSRECGAAAKESI